MCLIFQIQMLVFSLSSCHFMVLVDQTSKLFSVEVLSFAWLLSSHVWKCLYEHVTVAHWIKHFETVEVMKIPILESDSSRDGQPCHISIYCPLTSDIYPKEMRAARKVWLSFTTQKLRLGSPVEKLWNYSPFHYCNCSWIRIQSLIQEPVFGTEWRRCLRRVLLCIEKF